MVAYDGTQKCNIATKFIFIGCNEAFIEANLEMPKEDLGISGYYIKTLHNSCFIQAETSHGYQMGAICFSKYVLGYENIKVYDGSMMEWSNLEDQKVEF